MEQPRAEEPRAPSAIGAALRGGTALVALFMLLVFGIIALVVVRLTSVEIPPASTTRTVLAPNANVLVSIRDLSRLETVSYHMERVVDLTDEQTHLFGLITSRDAILLVAAGDVVAGVDLEDLREADVVVDQTAGRATLRLPPPKIFATTIDNDRTRVYTRETDVLASRHEDLEERARREAQKAMEQAALDAGILDRAKTGAERSITALVRSLGYREVRIEWRKK